MTDPTARDIVRRRNSYLAALRRELRDLPRGVRKEVVADIGTHLDEALLDAAPVTAEDAASIIRRLGTPAEVAAAARAELGRVGPPRGPRAFEIVTVILLLVGGVVVPVIGWLVGFVMLWASRAWSVRDKLIGTLVVPGGLSLAAFALVFGGSSEACTSSSRVVAVRPGSARTTVVDGAMHCTTSGFQPPLALVIVGLVVLVAGPVFTTFWLLRHARTDTNDGHAPVTAYAAA